VGARALLALSTPGQAANIHQAAKPLHHVSCPPNIVLDTQSVLDWLVFNDPSCNTWTATTQTHAWQWVGTSAMVEELDRVLSGGFGPRWHFDRSALLLTVAQRIKIVATPPRNGAPALRCRDPDDQIFIDLAVGIRAQALISRDLAVLRLGRKAWLLHGLPILRPRDWTPPTNREP
jgi:predicted nucleic acid-binding protein